MRAWLGASVAALSLSLLKQQVQEPTFEKVLTLLNNLVLEIDRDAGSDDADYASFDQWFKAQDASSTESVGALNARLQELGASLTDLHAHRQTTTGQVEQLRGEKATQDEQLSQATSKREEEHGAFVKEQTDFDNSISACARAAELLTAHYGDGTPAESTRPGWMSLSALFDTIRHTAGKHNHKVPTVLMQGGKEPGYFNANGASLYDQYQDSTDEALSVVDQVKQLGKTFAEDKASAEENEAALVKAYTTLSEEKKKVIGSLVAQINELSAVVTTAEEQIAEEAAAEQTAQVSLQNEQAYLMALRSQQQDVTNSYQQRKRDRADEREALREAQALLTSPSFLQQPCVRCAKATALLRSKAAELHSDLLLAAAADASSPDAMTDVITELEGLLKRIDEAQASEASHAAWCQKEMTAATDKRTQHNTLGAEAEQSLKNTEQLASEKQQAIDNVRDDVADLDSDWEQQEQFREKQHKDFELQMQDSINAAAALQQAESMLSAFYGQPPTFLQVARQPELPDAPATLSTPYSRVGNPVLAAIGKLRADFEATARDAEAAEKAAKGDFEAAQARFESSRAALIDSGTQLTQQLQTAEQDKQTLTESIESHKDAVDGALAYLSDLRRSCGSLTSNFSRREEQRKNERAVVEEAIAVLKGQA